MHRFKRTDRVGELIHRELSKIIDTEIRDARLGMVTVTGVDIARDLKTARVYISVLGDDDELKRSLEALAHAAGYIRSCLGERISLKTLPALEFRYDKSIVAGMEMDALLNELNHQA